MTNSEKYKTAQERRRNAPILPGGIQVKNYREVNNGSNPIARVEADDWCSQYRVARWAKEEVDK